MLNEAQLSPLARIVRRRRNLRGIVQPAQPDAYLHAARGAVAALRPAARATRRGGGHRFHPLPERLPAGNDRAAVERHARRGDLGQQRAPAQTDGDDLRRGGRQRRYHPLVDLDQENESDDRQDDTATTVAAEVGQFFTARKRASRTISAARRRTNKTAPDEPEPKRLHRKGAKNAERRKKNQLASFLPMPLTEKLCAKNDAIRRSAPALHFLRRLCDLCDFAPSR